MIDGLRCFPVVEGRCELFPSSDERAVYIVYWLQSEERVIPTAEVRLFSQY